MLKFRCGNCKQKIGVPEEYAGKRVRCPRCKQASTVPHPGELAADSPQVAARTVSQKGEPAARPEDRAPAIPPPAPLPTTTPPVIPPGAVTEPVVVATPPSPDLAAVFAQYMPAAVDPAHAPADDFWENRLPAGADVSFPEEPVVENTEPLKVSKTMDVEVSGPVTAEVMEPPPARTPARTATSEEQLDELFRDLGAPELPPDEPPPTYPTQSFDAFAQEVDSAQTVHRDAQPAPALPRLADASAATVGTAATILGMGGIFFGLGAIALCWFTGAAKFAVPLATAGLVMALSGVVIAALRNAPRIALPSLGTLVGALGIAYPVLGAFGVIPLPGRGHARVPGSTPVVNVSLPPSDASALPAAQSIPAEGFLPATSAIIAGEVQVRVSSVRIVQPVVHDGHWNSIHSLPDKRLLVSLELKDVAASGRVTYRTWAQPFNGEQATVVDGAGNALKPIDTAPLVPLGRVGENPATLYAGRSAIPDLLIFERPADTSAGLKLQLPGANIGLPPTALRIRIPAEMIQQ